MEPMTIDNLKRLLCREIDEYSNKPKLTMPDLETVHMLTDTYKNLDKIEMLEEGEYSQGNGKWSAEGSYAGDNAQRGGRYSRGYDRDEPMSRAYDRADGYDRGNSYARQHYVRGHYSRDDGKPQMLSQMQDMLYSDKLDQRQKETLRKAIEQMQE